MLNRVAVVKDFPARRRRKSNLRQAPRRLCLLAAAALACAGVAPAQERAPQKSPPRPSGQQPKQPAGAREKERQAAVTALLEAAEAARAVEHPGDRMSLIADAADALWPLDEPAARALLRRAWETTTAPGALEAFRPTQEGGRFGARELILSARQNIITRAARHDVKLAESFMQEFERGLPAEEEEEAAEEITPVGGRQSAASREPSPEGRRRIWTASALIEGGDYAAAAAVLAPLVAEGINYPFLDLLYRLRALSPRDADPIYLRLLERTRADASADAGDVLLLSTPVVSPQLFVTVGADGSTSLRPAPRPGAAEAAPSPALRRAFYDTAAAVLLREPPARGGEETRGVESLSPYFALGRLLPFFEREAPQYAAPLRARLAALTQGIDEGLRDSVDENMHTQRITPRNPTDPLQEQLGTLERAATDEERDAARFDAVSAAALRKLWERGRQMASQIGDPTTRRAAFLMLAAEQVKTLGEAFGEKEADDYERAAAFARAADVPAAMRAQGLAQAAELAARRGKRQRAAELFGEAVALSAQADRGTDLRVALLSLLTLSASRIDPARAWELLPEVAAAVNELEERSRSEEEPARDCPGVTVEPAVNSYCVELADPLPEAAEVFAGMARLNLERSLAGARTLKGDYSRARALISAARAWQAGAASAR
jgi:hypothetical protein